MLSSSAFQQKFHNCTAEQRTAYLRLVQLLCLPVGPADGAAASAPVAPAVPVTQIPILALPLEFQTHKSSERGLAPATGPMVEIAQHVQVSEVLGPVPPNPSAYPAVDFSQCVAVNWRPSHKLPRKTLDKLQRHNMRPYTVLEVSAQMETVRGRQLPAWTSCTWRTTAILTQMAARLWPSQTRAYLTRLGRDPRTAAALSASLRLGNLGVDLNAPATPYRVTMAEDEADVSVEEINRNRDIIPVGKACLVLGAGPDGAQDWVHWHRMTGAYVGSTLVRRAAHLLADLQAAGGDAESLVPSVLSAMRRHAVQLHEDDKHSEPLQKQAHRWRTLEVMTQVFQTQTEWFSSPLDHSAHIPRYASRCAADSAFGALHDAYKCTWEGSGYFNMPYTAADISRALQWAVASAAGPAPTLNVALIPHLHGHQSLTHVLSHSCVHRLCAIPVTAAGRFTFSPPEFDTNQQSKHGGVPHCMTVVLVSSAAGRRTFLRAAALPSLKAAWETCGAQCTNWDVDFGSQNVDNNAPAFSLAEKPPASASSQAGVGSLGREVHLRNLQQYIVESPALRIPDWKHVVYTDGSKQDEGLFGGVVHPSQDYKCRLVLERGAPRGHDGRMNTVVRAELAAIHHAVYHIRLDRPMTLMTDSLNSFQLIVKE